MQSVHKQVLRDPNLRDVERHVEQCRKRQRPAAKIGDVISKLLARRGYARVQSVAQFDQVWKQIAGDELARHSRPTQLRRGVLQIVVGNSIAMQELTFRKADLLAQVREKLANQGVRDLRFQIGTLPESEQRGC